MSAGQAGEVALDQGQLSVLVEETAQGNERALARLYEATSRIVYGLALRIVREASVAEDVTLEVFLQVWRTAANYDPSRGSVISWLAILARTRALDWLRSSHSRFKQQSHSLDEAAKFNQFKDATPDPEHASIEASRTRIVRKSMGELPVEQRELIELAYYSGLSHSEIAGRVGQPLGTVKSRIRLGMAQLRDSLGQYAEGGF
jgi:RNA polymerase sigma-70 factor (ECF subfamily)